MRNSKRKFKSFVAILLCIASVLSFCGCTSNSKLTARNSPSGIRLDWEVVENAETYQIEKKSGKEWIVLKSTAKNTFTDKMAEDGSRYEYRVRAKVNGKLKGKMTESATRIAPVEFTSVRISRKAITLNWEPRLNATKVVLYRAVEGEDLKKYETFKATDKQFVDEKVEEGIGYTYALTRVTKYGESPFPAKKTSLVLSTKLDSVSAKNSPSGVVVSWKGEVAGATGFAVYRKARGTDKWVKAGQASASETTFVDSSSELSKYMLYKVCPLLGSAEGEGTEAKKEIYAIDPQKKLVALTYDDGPYTPVTNSILDTMEKYGVRCTFFCVGDRVDTYAECVKRADKLGCEVASHTYNHTYMSSSLPQSTIEDITSKAKAVIEKYISGECTLLRPPGGFVNPLARYPRIMWSVDTEDWKNRNAETTLSRAKAGIYDGSIVLMHDLYQSSAEATKSLVPYLLENGYDIVTVSELFEARGIELQNGVSYAQAKRQ